MPSRVAKSLSIVVAIVVCASFQVSYASKRENTYKDFQNAVLKGKDMRMILDLSACMIQGSANPGPSVRGSLHFDGYMIEQDGSIAFATTHFTLKKDDTPVDEFLSFRVLPTGKVLARTRFLNASTYIVFHDAQFDCELGKGVAFQW